MARQEEHQVGEKLQGVGADREGGWRKKRGEGKAAPFCSVCLHHQRGIPGIQASRPPGRSPASPLMLSIFGSDRGCLSVAYEPMCEVLLVEVFVVKTSAD